MVIELKAGSVTAKIDTKGAELISLTNAAGTEYMWQKDPKYWARSSPVLFPIVGNLRNDKTWIGGKEYHMSKHGFCRDAEFRILAQSTDSVVLSYSANEETLTQYPYKFELILSYKLTETAVHIHYTVANRDDNPIDYCLGAHPAFSIPMDKSGDFEDCFLEFSEPETAKLPIFDFANNQIDMSSRITYLEEERRLPLKYSHFDNDALIFDSPRSNRVTLANSRSGWGVEVTFHGFDFVAFWTPIKLEAPFLCIEPWCGMAVCSDEDDIYEKKRGIQHLEKDESKEYELIIRPL